MTSAANKVKTSICNKFAKRITKYKKGKKRITNRRYTGHLQLSLQSLENTGIEGKKRNRAMSFFTKTHNPEVAGSSPVPATRKKEVEILISTSFFVVLYYILYNILFLLQYTEFL